MTSDDAFAHLLAAIREVQAVYNARPCALTDNQRRLLFVAHAGVTRVAAELRRQNTTTPAAG